MLTQNRTNRANEGTSYRNFSRLRYNELKGQMPSLRESEIVKKIMVQWEGMSPADRKKYLHPDTKSIPLNLATPTKNKDLLNNQKTTGEKKPEKEESHSSVNLDDINVREFQVGEPKASKTRRIRKPTEYVTFFKSYFSKLRQEHAKWSSNQITSVIKLLWCKKKHLDHKMPKQTRRLSKPLSAFKAFGNAKKREGLEHSAIRAMWKGLPRESRMNWNSDGTRDLTTMRGVIKMSSSSNSSAERPLNFMKHSMM